MALPKIHGEFRLWADVDLRFTPAGKAVAAIPLVASDRRKNEQSQEWEDTETLFIRGTAWEQMAEMAAETLTKGSLVVVEGRPYVREFEKDGVKQRSVELKIDSIGPSLRFRPRNQQGGQQQAQGAPAQQQGGYPPQQQSQAPQQGQQQAQSGPWGDVPPF